MIWVLPFPISEKSGINFLFWEEFLSNVFVDKNSACIENGLNIRNAVQIPIHHNGYRAHPQETRMFLKM